MKKRDFVDKVHALYRKQYEYYIKNDPILDYEGNPAEVEGGDRGGG